MNQLHPDKFTITVRQLKKISFYTITLSMTCSSIFLCVFLYLRFSYLIVPIVQSTEYEVKLKISQREGYYKFEPGMYYNDSKSSAFSINADGFRGATRKADLHTKYSIVALGESSTMGIEVADPYTWPALLETQLNKLGRGFATLNAGVGGINSTQMLRLYEAEIRDLKPRAIIYYAGRNDQALGLALSRYPGNQNWPSGFTNWFKQYLIFKKFQFRYFQFRVFGKQYLDLLPNVNPWQRIYERNLSHLIQYAKEDKTCFIIMQQMMPYEKTIIDDILKQDFNSARKKISTEQVAWPDLFRQLDVYESQVKIAKATDTPFVTLYSDVEKFTDGLFQPSDTIHLTKEGNALIAEKLTNVIADMCKLN